MISFKDSSDRKAHDFKREPTRENVILPAACSDRISILRLQCQEREAKELPRRPEELPHHRQLAQCRGGSQVGIPEVEMSVGRHRRVQDGKRARHCDQ